MKKIYIAFLTLIVASTPLSLAAENISPCSALVRECFAYENVERSTCFHAAANHSFCQNQSQASLARQRWEMSPVQEPGLEDASALLGPKMVNTECLRKFDTQWSSALMNGDLTARQILHLRQLLKSCENSLAENMLRP
jgi:hypothetical protein